MQPGGSSADTNLYATVDSMSFGRRRETECALRHVNLEKSDEDYKELIQAIASSGQRIAASKAFFQESIDETESPHIQRRSELERLSFCNFFDRNNASKSLEELIETAELIN